MGPVLIVTRTAVCSIKEPRKEKLTSFFYYFLLQHKKQNRFYLFDLQHTIIVFSPWLFVNFFKKGAVIEAILVISNTSVQTNNLNGIDDKAALQQQLINTSNVFFLYPHNINKKKKNTNSKVFFFSFIHQSVVYFFYIVKIR